ncbi:MAG: hypothetical protein HS104_16815 [Polyangiaceae bacterium]|nr:hypothetical protein [Polyangiaceae bacterium]
MRRVSATRPITSRRGTARSYAQSDALERTKARAKALERAGAAEPARRALGFARALAKKLALPPGGLQIFKAHRGRCVTRAWVMPDGSLYIQHLVQPFAAFNVHARRKSDLLDRTPADFIHALAAAIDSGEVWKHVRGNG